MALRSMNIGWRSFSRSRGVLTSPQLFDKRAGSSIDAARMSFSRRFARGNDGCLWRSSAAGYGRCGGAAEPKIHEIQAGIYLDDDHIGIYGTKMIGEKWAEFLMQKSAVSAH